MSEADQDQSYATPIGERLRVAREAMGLTLDDVATRTRIPTRHLQHIEQEEWSALPATTYSVGFARAYANAVGLNGSVIGAELREQLGGATVKRPAAPAPYEPADPARVPPRSLALVAGIIALLLIAGYLIWRNSAVDDPTLDPAAMVIAEAEQRPNPPPAARPAPAPAPATGPVVLTATEEVWLRVYEQGGSPKLYEGTLQPGQRYEVPPTARAPQIITGRPNALRVTVGNTAIPPLGEPERTISDVSLLAADLIARAQPQQGAQPPAR